MLKATFMISDLYCKKIIKQVLSRDCVISWEEGGLTKFSVIKRFNPLNNTVLLKTIADENGKWPVDKDEYISIDLLDKSNISNFKIKTIPIDEFKILLIK